jgi:hypothetical protein
MDNFEHFLSMTRNEALTILDSMDGNAVIPVAKAAEMLKAWEAGGVASERVIDILARLRPAEVLELAAVAERKLARRNRPR